MIADDEVVRGRKKFIIIILKDNLSISELPKTLKLYMKSHTYIDATKNTDLVMNRLRYV